MPNFTAREMLARLPVRMADGGELDAPGVSAAYRKAMETGGQRTVEDYYANLRRQAVDYLADPKAPTGADAYNILVQSGISTSDLKNAGVADAVLNKIFTVTLPAGQTTATGQVTPGAPIQYTTPADMTSAYMRSPDLMNEAERLTGLGQSARTQLDKQGYDYVKNLQQGGIDANERAQMLEYATERGYTFDDLRYAGVDPSILFNQITPAAKPYVKPPPGGGVTPPPGGGVTPIPGGTDIIPGGGTTITPGGGVTPPPGGVVPPPFPQTQKPYTAETVYQPLPLYPDIYAAGQPALDTAFRESAPRTAIADMPGYFNYTPAATLKPATGAGYTWTPPSVTSRPRSLLSPSTIKAYGGLESASQKFARERAASGAASRAGLETGVRAAVSQLPPALQNLSTYNQLRNRLMSQEFGDPTRALDPQTLEGAAFLAALEKLKTGGTTTGTTGGTTVTGTGTGTGTVADTTTAGGYAEPIEANPLTYGGYREFSRGGAVKKPEGFADGGIAASERIPLDPSDPLFITEDPRVSPDVQVPLDELIRRQMAASPRPTAPSPRMARAAQMAAQPQTESASMLSNLLSGAAQIPGSVYEYGKGIAQSERPLAALGEDVSTLAGGMYEGLKQDPIGFGLDMTPIIGEIRSGMDAKKYSDMANEAQAAGDTALADTYRQVATMAAAGAVPFGGIGARGARRAAMSDMVDVPPDSAREMMDALTPEAGGVPDVPEVDVPVESVPQVSATGDQVPLVVPNAEAKGHALPSLLLVEGTGEKATTPVTQQFTPQNKSKMFANIDTVQAQNPDALTSSGNWLRVEEQAFGGDYLPAPPSAAIRYVNNPERLAATLRRLSPDMKKSVDEGFSYVTQIKNLYNSGEASPEMTGRLFLWGILSRGAGPAQQEGAFLDLVSAADPFIKKAAAGNFTESDLNDWTKMAAGLIPEGSPGRSVIMNANAAGRLMSALSQVPAGSQESVLKSLHRTLSDPNKTGQQFRREFFASTQTPGIDNKVTSFIGLVAGKDDLLVMDRIQSRHLWDDGRYGGQNIYDGIDKGGLSGILGGPRGLMVTEMLENGMADTVKQAYEMIGRAEDASIGRMHWETWLISSNQPVSHSTLRAVMSGEPIGQSVTEGKRNTYSSGITYRQAINGPIVEYPLSDGSIVRMTPERQKEFEAFIQDPKNAIVPRKFGIKKSTDRPWFEQPNVNREVLDNAARQFENANPDGSLRSGDARNIESGSSLSGRRGEFLRAFRENQARIFRAGRNALGDSGGDGSAPSGPYRRESVDADGVDGLLSFVPDPNAYTQYQAAGLSVPAIRQVDSAGDATSYNADMISAMAKNPFSAQVEIKSPEDLASSRLFRTESGSGFAVKPDGDVVAVFASPSEPKGGAYAMLQAAVQAGGRKLDAFDTYLPDIYERVGFRPVARLPWNDDYAPPGWNKETFAEYNNGEPDVVFFVHDPEYFGGAKDVPVVSEYDQAVAFQDQALRQLTANPQGFKAGGAVTSSRRMLETLIGKKPKGQRVDASGLQRFANGGEASSSPTPQELLAQIDRSMANSPATAYGTASSAPAREVTESQNMLRRLSDAFGQNVTAPVVGSMLDMTTGLGDLAQLGLKAGANKLGIETKPFTPVSSALQEFLGVAGYDPYAPAALAASVLLPAAGPLRAAGAATRPMMSMAAPGSAKETLSRLTPILDREASVAASAELAAMGAREVAPDNVTAEIAAAIAGGGAYNTLDNILSSASRGPTTSGMAADDLAANNTEVFDAYHGTPHVFGSNIRVIDKSTGKEYVSDPSMVQTIMSANPDKYEILLSNPLGQFDLNRIGSGEGAQAYGYGTYIGEDPDVGRYYRGQLLGRAGVDDIARVGNEEINQLSEKILNRADKLPIGAAKIEYDKASILERIMIDGDILGVLQTQDSFTPEAFEWFTKEIAPKYNRPGAMYQLQVSSPKEMFLDWDKPVIEQSAEVRRKLAALPEVKATDTGESIYTAIRSGYMGMENRGERNASLLLNSLGIPGIQYLDAGSRMGGSGSKNYVLFDPKIAEITAKYGIAPLAVGAGAVAISSKDEPSEMSKGGHVTKKTKGA